MFEKDLKIYDLWESPNGNLFLKVSDEYSIAIGPKEGHEPNEHDLKISQFILKSEICPVKKVGQLVFDK